MVVQLSDARASVSCILKLSSGDCRKCLINVDQIFNDFEHISIKLIADELVTDDLKSAGLYPQHTGLLNDNKALERLAAPYASGLIFYDSALKVLEFCSIVDYPQKRTQLRYVFNHRIAISSFSIQGIFPQKSSLDGDLLCLIGNNHSQILITNIQTKEEKFKLSLITEDFYKNINKYISRDDFQYTHSAQIYNRRIVKGLMPPFMECLWVTTGANGFYALFDVMRNDSNSHGYTISLDHNLLIHFDISGLMNAWVVPLRKSTYINSTDFSISGDTMFTSTEYSTSWRSKGYHEAFLIKEGIVPLHKRKDKNYKRIQRKLKYSKEILMEYDLLTPLYSRNKIIYPTVGWYTDLRGRNLHQLEIFDPFWNKRSIDLIELSALLDVIEQKEGTSFVISSRNGILIKSISGLVRSCSVVPIAGPGNLLLSRCNPLADGSLQFLTYDQVDKIYTLHTMLR